MAQSGLANWPDSQGTSEAISTAVTAAASGSPSRERVQRLGEGWVGKYSTDETLDVRLDSGSPASREYASPNDFGGTLHKVVIDAHPANLTAADLGRIGAAQQALRRGTE